MFPWWKSNNSSQVHTTLLRYRSPVIVMFFEELMLPTLEIKVHKVQYWALSLLQEFYQKCDTWGGANRCAPKTRKHMKLLNFGRGKVRFFYFKMMIVLSVFKHLKVNGSFDNLCQSNAFLGSWGWIDSTKMLWGGWGGAMQLQQGVLTPLTSCPS